MKHLLRFVLWVALAVVAVAQPIRPWLNPGISDPRNLTGLAAWYDVSDTSSLLSSTGTTITDGGAVALWSDKSGNSGTNALVIQGAANNGATFTTGTAVGTNDFTVVAKFSVPLSNPSSNVGIAEWSSSNTVGTATPTASSFGVKIGTTGVLQVVLYGATPGAQVILASVNTNLVSTYAGQVVTVSVTRASTTLTIYINGASVAFTTNDFGSGQTFAGSITSTNTNIGYAGATQVITSCIYAVRCYSVALDAAGILADYNGTVQASIFGNVNFSAFSKLAASRTATTGQTVTINGAGATGARIAGERDLFQGTAANRPVYLAYSGTKYSYHNGVSGNNISTPDADALDITGVLDIDFDAALVDWSPSAVNSAIIKAGAYGLQVFTNGNARIIWVDSGLVIRTVESNAAIPFSDLARGSLRVTLDVSTGTIKFYTSTDGTTWSQLGTTITFGATSIVNSTGVLTVGSSGASETVNGRIYRARVYSGLRESGGTLKADFNPALYTSGTTFTASTGEVWTLNGGATIVTRSCLYFDGSNDYLKSAAFSYSQPESVYFVGSQVTWTLTDYILEGFGSSNRRGVTQQLTTPGLSIYGGSSVVAENAGLATKAGGVVSAVFNGASSLLRINRGIATTGSPGTNASNGLTLGSSYDGANNANITVSELILRSAADATATQDAFILYEQIKWQIW